MSLQYGRFNYHIGAKLKDNPLCRRLPPLPHECDSGPMPECYDDVMTCDVTVQATNDGSSRDPSLSCPTHKHNRLLQTPEVQRRKFERKKQQAAVNRKSSLVLFAYGLM